MSQPPAGRSTRATRVAMIGANMGDTQIQSTEDPARYRAFVQRVLDDVRALEAMLESGCFETGKKRLGAEQELFLVDGGGRPMAAGPEVLDRIADPRFTTELARFNLEANLDPVDLEAGCFDALESELDGLLEVVHEAAAAEGGDVMLIGILPTLEQADLGLENMTPIARYDALDEAVRRLRGGGLRCHIRGRDELSVQHENVMLEACNTSFQVHLQVAAEDFSRRYNIAQLITAPVLACATFSPLLFGKRLWHETRIALFRQAVDTRESRDAWRHQPPRVTFGERWLDHSVLEIFREDIARFALMLTAELGEPSTETLRAGRVPGLRALRIHNGTVYRWNRPCYGISPSGAPHLRIENRVLPAGPTVRDEVANTAFWIGLMHGLDGALGDLPGRMGFGTVRENFLAAARLGIDAQLRWLDGRPRPVASLIQEELLPAAREGLADLGIEAAESDRYLGVVAERVEKRRTGSHWLLDSLSALGNEGSGAERMARVTAAARANQAAGRPVHTWPLLAAERTTPEGLYARVSALMTTDLFTVGEDEVIDLVASIMDWRHVRHVPVEDPDHRLVGLITHRTLLRVLARLHGRAHEPIPVRDVMKRSVISVGPSTPTLDALEIMRAHRAGCLPVVEEGRLVGIVTERDFMRVAERLLERHLRQADPDARTAAPALTDEPPAT